ncbi:hypothetical protein [Paraburkholderia sp. J10-1]|uniref:hypothetical protein n=1 Tax=Paraburkholderia sp. J10-1 TaxID=2805430 RepID=UPI002AB7B1AD|nr:hypothetical protein [Paraburkholderia sp. J10-1]
MDAKELKPCAECGMHCEAGEYHPFAACLMFKQTRNAESVRANLKAVAEHAVAALPSDAAQSPIGFRTRVPGFAWVPWITDDQETIKRTIQDALDHGHQGEALYAAPVAPAALDAWQDLYARAMATLAPAFDYIQAHADQFGATGGDCMMAIIAETLPKLAAADAAQFVAPAVPLGIDSGAALKVAECIGMPLDPKTLAFAHAIVKLAYELNPVAPAAAAPTLLGSPAEGHWGEPETPSDGHKLESDVDEEAQPDERAAFDLPPLPDPLRTFADHSDRAYSREQMIAYAEAARATAPQAATEDYTRTSLRAIQAALCEVDPKWRDRGEFGVKPHDQIIAAIRDLAAVPQAGAEEALTRLMQWQDGAGLLWDVFDRHGRWFKRVVSPIGWDAHTVYLAMMEARYAPHIDVRLVSSTTNASPDEPTHPQAGAALTDDQILSAFVKQHVHVYGEDGEVRLLGNAVIQAVRALLAAHPSEQRMSDAERPAYTKGKA